MRRQLGMMLILEGHYAKAMDYLLDALEEANEWRASGFFIALSKKSPDRYSEYKLVQSSIAYAAIYALDRSDDEALADALRARPKLLDHYAPLYHGLERFDNEAEQPIGREALQNRPIREGKLVTGRIEAKVAFPELRVAPDASLPEGSLVFRVASIELKVRNPANKQWESHDEAKPDASGTFVFDGVPVGTVKLVPKFHPCGHLHGLELPADVVAWRTTKVTFGGKGRPVVGKVSLRESLETARKRIRIRVHLQTPEVPGGEGSPPSWQLYAALPKSQQRQVGCPIDAAGRFRFDGVAPGKYWLQVYLDGDQEHLFEHKFTIPLTMDTSTLDIGTLVVPSDDHKPSSK